MAVTATLVKQTPHALAYRLTHDGAGGDQVTFTRAALLADAVAGPLRQLLSDPAIQASVGAMAQALMGIAVGATDLTRVEHCQCFATVITGQTIPEVDVAAGPVLAIDMTPATAAQVLLLIKFQHTVPR